MDRRFAGRGGLDVTDADSQGKRAKMYSPFTPRSAAEVKRRLYLRMLLVAAAIIFLIWALMEAGAYNAPGTPTEKSVGGAETGDKVEGSAATSEEGAASSKSTSPAGFSGAAEALVATGEGLVEKVSQVTDGAPKGEGGKESGESGGETTASSNEVGANGDDASGLSSKVVESADAAITESTGGAAGEGTAGEGDSSHTGEGDLPSLPHNLKDLKNAQGGSKEEGSTEGTEEGSQDEKEGHDSDAAAQEAADEKAAKEDEASSEENGTDDASDHTEGKEKVVLAKAGAEDEAEAGEEKEAAEAKGAKADAEEGEEENKEEGNVEKSAKVSVADDDATAEDDAKDGAKDDTKGRSQEGTGGKEEDEEKEGTAGGEKDDTAAENEEKEDEKASSGAETKGETASESEDKEGSVEDEEEEKVTKPTGTAAATLTGRQKTAAAREDEGEEGETKVGEGKAGGEAEKEEASEEDEKDPTAEDDEEKSAGGAEDENNKSEDDSKDSTEAAAVVKILKVNEAKDAGEEAAGDAEEEEASTGGGGKTGGGEKSGGEQQAGAGGEGGDGGGVKRLSESSKEADGEEDDGKEESGEGGKAEEAVKEPEPEPEPEVERKVEVERPKRRTRRSEAAEDDVADEETHKLHMTPRFRQPSETDCKGRTIYMYPLPSQYNRGLIEQCTKLLPWQNMCPFFANDGFGPAVDSEELVPPGRWFDTHVTSLELIFYNRLRKTYPCLTADPYDANLFYIPFYGSLDLMRWESAEKSTEEDKDHLSNALVRWLSKKPYFLRFHGADHFIVLAKRTWDFRRRPGTEWGSVLLALPTFSKVTKLLLERNIWDENDVAIPHPTPFHPKTDKDLHAWQKHALIHKRPSLASYVAFPEAASPIKDVLAKQCKEQPFHCRYVECSEDSCSQPTTVMPVFLSSTFCLMPPGDSSVRRMAFWALLAGCIPVLTDDFNTAAQFPWHLPADNLTYSVYAPASQLRSGRLNAIDMLKDYRAKQIKAQRAQILNDIVPSIVYIHPRSKRSTGFNDATDTVIEKLLEKVRMASGQGSRQ
eukprot:TRINITY_DN14964_c0_g1_i1.p1 TRINITY_DN14964_c0_g1~~TRINITY_DN14964_c0_g1_i1.p1  ORF type:complete len:1046 (+),score=325.96 TRINITY_DN14964_c0_g1_i1:149-3286(+)